MKRAYLELKKMTMPHLMNCSHFGDGWCLECVKKLHEHTEECEDVLRSLASWLGTGGYNAAEVDPHIFEAKIRHGVEFLIAPLVDKAKQKNNQGRLSEWCEKTGRDIKDFKQ